MKKIFSSILIVFLAIAMIFPLVSFTAQASNASNAPADAERFSLNERVPKKQANPIKKKNEKKKSREQISA